MSRLSAYREQRPKIASPSEAAPQLQDKPHPLTTLLGWESCFFPAPPQAPTESVAEGEDANEKYLFQLLGKDNDVGVQRCMAARRATADVQVQNPSTITPKYVQQVVVDAARVEESAVSKVGATDNGSSGGFATLGDDVTALKHVWQGGLLRVVMSLYNTLGGCEHLTQMTVPEECSPSHHQRVKNAVAYLETFDAWTKSKDNEASLEHVLSGAGYFDKPFLVTAGVSTLNDQQEAKLVLARLFIATNLLLPQWSACVDVAVDKLSSLLSAAQPLDVACVVVESIITQAAAVGAPFSGVSLNDCVTLLAKLCGSAVTGPIFSEGFSIVIDKIFKLTILQQVAGGSKLNDQELHLLHDRIMLGLFPAMLKQFGYEWYFAAWAADVKKADTSATNGGGVGQQLSLEERYNVFMTSLFGAFVQKDTFPQRLLMILPPSVKKFVPLTVAEEKEEAEAGFGSDGGATTTASGGQYLGVARPLRDHHCPDRSLLCTSDDVDNNAASPFAANTGIAAMIQDVAKFLTSSSSWGGDASVGSTRGFATRGGVSTNVNKMGTESGAFGPKVSDTRDFLMLTVEKHPYIIATMNGHTRSMVKLFGNNAAKVDSLPMREAVRARFAYSILLAAILSASHPLKSGVSIRSLFGTLLRQLQPLFERLSATIAAAADAADSAGGSLKDIGVFTEDDYPLQIASSSSAAETHASAEQSVAAHVVAHMTGVFDVFAFREEEQQQSGGSGKRLDDVQLTKLGNGISLIRRLMDEFGELQMGVDERVVLGGGAGANAAGAVNFNAAAAAGSSGHHQQSAAGSVDQNRNEVSCSAFGPFLTANDWAEILQLTVQAVAMHTSGHLVPSTKTLQALPATTPWLRDFIRTLLERTDDGIAQIIEATTCGALTLLPKDILLDAKLMGQWLLHRVLMKDNNADGVVAAAVEGDDVMLTVRGEEPFIVELKQAYPHLVSTAVGNSANAVEGDGLQKVRNMTVDLRRCVTQRQAADKLSVMNALLMELN